MHVELLLNIVEPQKSHDMNWKYATHQLSTLGGKKSSKVYSGIAFIKKEKNLHTYTPHRQVHT
jgi:predicted house-cleaning NTP pyrophosphatase (Maf/HAM1 superfamily)